MKINIGEIYPADIKKMSWQELDELCNEIRTEIISTVSQNGGHLASNLGVVELTVALHKSFNAPEDKIVWDVGHQSYVHKLITGREGEFDSLRMYKGLSGFPKRSESEYDTFDTGHSSNSISAALGMAVARDIEGRDNYVVAVLGDGSLTGGMAYEALNNAGAMDTSLIVVLNDNAMSISKDHGGVSRHLSKLRTSDKYISIKQHIKSALKKIPVVGVKVFNGMEALRDSLKYMVVPGILFEEMGFTYLGPVDGHNIQDLTEVFQAAKNMKSPVLIHCMTTKGKGYKLAEERPDKFHGVSPFDKDTGIPLQKSKEKSYSDVFGETICKMAEDDEKIVAISAAMLDGTGLTEFAKQFPKRIFDVGIAEEHAVTFAAGLATQGLKPFVAIYSTFLQRAYDQIMIDVCMQKLPVTFCIDRAGVVGADGETHNGIFDISYMNHMPNMTILAPSNGTDLKIMLEYAAKSEAPCAIRYPRGSAEEKPEAADNEADYADFNDKMVPLIIREGTDVTLVAAGKMLHNALKASDILKSAGISAEVIDARILKPLDENFYQEIAGKTKLVITLEDNVVTGGFGSTIESLFAANNDIRVYNLGWPDTFIEQGTQDELMRAYGLDAEGIAEKVRKIIEGKA